MKIGINYKVIISMSIFTIKSSVQNVSNTINIGNDDFLRYLHANLAESTSVRYAHGAMMLCPGTFIYFFFQNTVVYFTPRNSCSSFDAK